MRRFYLGTHMPNWLGQTRVPLFVSRRRLADRRTFPRALGPWALDSGGFTELAMYGRWETTARQYEEPGSGLALDSRPATCFRSRPESGGPRPHKSAGVDLASLPLVGVGSVCRRQASFMTSFLFFTLGLEGLKCHGFGLKTQGLRNEVQQLSSGLVSADSLAWSSTARRERPLSGHTHKNCANCLEFALLWRDRLPAEWLGREARVA